jgi:ribosomal protein S18 acetylase RimI-like enzyme
VNIRAFEESDRDGVIALWREVFPDSPPHNDPATDINRKLKMQRELFLVAESNGKIVGTAMAGYDGHRGWVYYVAVGSKHRRQGIGRALMEAIEDGLQKLGCHKLNLQVRSSNKQAVEFYEKLGYRIEDRVSMAKHLKN